MKRGTFQYLLDFCYATFRFHNGFTKPRAYWGYFNSQEQSKYQKMVFKLLLNHGYQRTLFQLVFPGQTAGIIKKIGDGREYHVRFYSDGTIECEEEVGRFDTMHYAGKRVFNHTPIVEVLTKNKYPQEICLKITKLFGFKEFCEQSIR